MSDESKNPFAGLEGFMEEDTPRVTSASPEKGHVCEVYVAVGYKVFVKGLDFEKSFVPILDGDQVKARAKADELIPVAERASLKQGGKKWPQHAVRFILQEPVLNRETSWRDGNMIRDVVMDAWRENSAWNEFLKDNLYDNLHPEDLKGNPAWMHIAYRPDPRDADKEMDSEDVRWIPYVVKRFADKGEAIAYLKEAGVEIHGKTVDYSVVEKPAEYSPEIEAIIPWEEAIRNIVGKMDEISPNSLNHMQLKRVQADTLGENVSLNTLQQIDDLRTDAVPF